MKAGVGVLLVGGAASRVSEEPRGGTVIIGSVVERAEAIVVGSSNWAASLSEAEGAEPVDPVAALALEETGLVVGFASGLSGRGSAGRKAGRFADAAAAEEATGADCEGF